MHRTRTLLLAGLALSACDAGPTQPSVPTQPPSRPSLSNHASTTTTQFSVFFQATAMCPSDIGRIQFSGTIEGTDHTTVDGNGETHRTRQFRVQGLDGLNLDYGTVYSVIGGAEMLRWSTQIGQVPGVAAQSIHAGTLVFEPVGGGPKVVAHHAIRFVENADGELVVNFSSWSCRTSS